MNGGYPLLLSLAGKPVLVVGGGQVAARRARALVDAGAAVRIVAPRLHPPLRALAEAGALLHEPREYADGDVAGAWLVHACTDVPEVNAAVAAAAEAAQVFCVRADDRDASAAWVPAVAREGDVVVAVNAGGAPARARALRDHVAVALFGSESTPGPADLEEARGKTPVIPRASSRSAQEGSPQKRSAQGLVSLVGAGPGDPGLLTLRARDALAAADVVLMDRLVDRGALAHLPASAQVIDVGKRGWATRAGEQQVEIERLLVKHARAGRRVVRLKGGDPFVFGRGGEEALACVEAGVPFEVIPGVTSAIAVPAYAGIPVTMRGATHDVSIVSGHLDPDDPASQVRWRAYAEGAGTLVVLMGLAKVGEICAALVGYGRPADTPAACLARGTTPGQRAVVSDLAHLGADVEAAHLPSPAITVVGEVVRLREHLQWFAGAVDELA